MCTAESAALIVLVGLTGSACPAVGDAERLFVGGTLEREGIEGTQPGAVEVSYLSEGSRGEWWPCDARFTAQGCVNDHHVNVYLTKPQVTLLEEVAGAWCVIDGVPQGVYEAFDEPGKSEFDLGTELGAFVLVASDATGEAGAELSSDIETTAASRITSGSLHVVTVNGLEGRTQFILEGETAQGNEVRIEFGGPMSNPGVIPPLEGPASCVDGALVD